MHGLDTSNVSSRDEPSGIWAYASSERRSGKKALKYNYRIVMYFTEKFVLHIVNNLLYDCNDSSTETASNSSFDETINEILV